MSEYSDRLKVAMGRVSVEVSALAKHLEISYTAVKKAYDGKSTFSAFNNSKAARFLGVDSDWLATGEGEPDKQAGEPFRDLDVFEGQLVAFFRKLSPDLRHDVLVALNKLAADGKASNADPYPAKSGAKRGISVFGDLGEDKGAPKK